MFFDRYFQSEGCGLESNNFDFTLLIRKEKKLTENYNRHQQREFKVCLCNAFVKDRSKLYSG